MRTKVPILFLFLALIAITTPTTARAGGGPATHTINIQIIYLNGTGINGVTITMINSTQILFSVNTNGTGQIAEQTIEENNTTLTAAIEGFLTYSHNYEVSGNLNLVIRLFTLDESMTVTTTFSLVLSIFAGLSLITFIGMIISTSLVISVSAAVVSFMCWGVTALYYLYENPAFPGPAVLFMLFAAISLIYAVYAGLQLINPYRREELDDI